MKEVATSGKNNEYYKQEVKLVNQLDHKTTENKPQNQQHLKPTAAATTKTNAWHTQRILQSFCKKFVLSYASKPSARATPVEWMRSFLCLAPAVSLFTNVNYL